LEIYKKTQQKANLSRKKFRECRGLAKLSRNSGRPSRRGIWGKEGINSKKIWKKNYPRKVIKGKGRGNLHPRNFKEFYWRNLNWNL